MVPVAQGAQVALRCNFELHHLQNTRGGTSGTLGYLDPPGLAEVLRYQPHEDSSVIFCPAHHRSHPHSVPFLRHPAPTSTLISTEGTTPFAFPSLLQFWVPDLGNMPNDFTEGCTPIRPISAQLPQWLFSDQFSTSEGISIFCTGCRGQLASMRIQTNVAS